MLRICHVVVSGTCQVVALVKTACCCLNHYTKGTPNAGRQILQGADCCLNLCTGREGLLRGEECGSGPAQGGVPVVHALQLLQPGAAVCSLTPSHTQATKLWTFWCMPACHLSTFHVLAMHDLTWAPCLQEDSCCTDPHRWMKPLVCPQDFLENDVCALHFVGWRKSGMPAVFEASPKSAQHLQPLQAIMNA